MKSVWTVAISLTMISAVYAAEAQKKSSNPPRVIGATSKPSNGGCAKGDTNCCGNLATSLHSRAGGKNPGGVYNLCLGGNYRG